MKIQIWGNTCSDLYTLCASCQEWSEDSCCWSPHSWSLGPERWKERIICHSPTWRFACSLAYFNHFRLFAAKRSTIFVEELLPRPKQLQEKFSWKLTFPITDVIHWVRVHSQSIHFHFSVWHPLWHKNFSVNRRDYEFEKRLETIGNVKNLLVERTTAAALTKCVRFWFPQVNISRDGCGVSKVCVAEPENCDPAENNMCILATFESASRPPNVTLLRTELSGYSMDFIALGLTRNSSMVKPTSHAPTFKFRCTGQQVLGAWEKLAREVHSFKKSFTSCSKKRKVCPNNTKTQKCYVNWSRHWCVKHFHTFPLHKPTQRYLTKANSLVWELLGFHWW